MAANEVKPEKRNGSTSRGLRLLRAFVENPKQVASIVPSSTALQRHLAELPCLRNARFIVELGPGTGETTTAILSAIPSSSEVLAVELIPECAAEVARIGDHRLRILEGDALELGRILAERQPSTPDVVISGVPFSHLSREDGRHLVDAVYDALVPGGTFVAYQFRDRVCELAKDRFGTPQKSFVPWNLPPLDVYQWVKPISADDVHPAASSGLTPRNELSPQFG